MIPLSHACLRKHDGCASSANSSSILEVLRPRYTATTGANLRIFATGRRQESNEAGIQKRLVPRKDYEHKAEWNHKDQQHDDPGQASREIQRPADADSLFHQQRRIVGIEVEQS